MKNARNLAHFIQNLGFLEKNNENFRGNLGKNKKKKYGEKPESGLGIFRENWQQNRENQSGPSGNTAQTHRTLAAKFVWEHDTV